MYKACFAMRIAMAASLGLAPCWTAGLAAQQAAPRRAVVPSVDPEWVEVNKDEDATSYVDRRSIRNTGGQVRFVGRIDYARPQSDGAVRLLHSGLIDCARHDFRIVALDSLRADGELVSTFTLPPEEPANPINPGSPNEALHQEYCG